LPKKLDDLVPEFLESVPRDPFSGDRAPLRYRVNSDGSWLVYSVGPDMNDDAGVAEWNVETLPTATDCLFASDEARRIRERVAARKRMEAARE